MQTYTLGVNYYPGMKVPLICNPDDDFSCKNLDEFYRLVIVEKGTGFICNGKYRELVTAPAVLCFNELEFPELEKSSDFKAKSVFFNPNFINSAFNYENLRNGSEGFLLTDIRDRHWLRPFFIRNEAFNGKLFIGYVNLKKILQLFDILSFELLEQRDDFWPCRSRSYLIEMLFQVERSYMDPQPKDRVIVNNISEEISKIILFLHSNYQNKVTLDELAREFHINRTTLNKRFNDEIGVSIMTYLIKLRISLATALLRDTMVPIVEIMDRVGFKDSAHFVRMFRKNAGSSPSEYRQQNCWLLR